MKLAQSKKYGGEFGLCYVGMVIRIGLVDLMNISWLFMRKNRLFLRQKHII